MRTILSILLMFCCGITFAQTTITGTVVDNNNIPIPSANVIVIGTSSGTVTDFDGNFNLTVNQNPPFTIQASSIGFESTTQEVTANNQNINFVLNEGTALDEVVVSASRTPERIRESPVTVERLDAKGIKTSSSATFFDSLENLKGVDMNTNSLTFKSVNTRGFAGFANTRFMQLVDGMDNSSPALNFALGNLLGMSELDVNTVELLPGASSALYGANAFNGIMFMTSKNPFDHTGVSTYVKTGLTSSDNAGDNQFYDIGVRVANKFSDAFAAKASVSYLKGTEWYATDYTDYNNRGWTRENPGYDGLNVYGDEVATTLDMDNIASTNAFPIPLASNYGKHYISRTGYNESDLIDYEAESLKADFALHFKPWKNDFEIVLNSKVGRGNTIYQGANRYSIKDFFMQQHKLELRNDNFFVRGYVTAEKAGNSFDSRFAGININRFWKPDQQWFEDYAAGFLGATAGQGIFDPNEAQLAQAHATARANADSGRLIPGTPQFERAFDIVTADPDLATGAKFQDASKIYHADANYNFAHLVDFVDIMAGGSFRQYSLNSFGTIYTDNDGPINYNEYGAYVQLQKKLLEERLKFTGSLRYDKSEFFDGFVSPRISFVYAADELKNHNIRGSFQSGFRNPTTQDLFIGLQAGRAILVGSAPANLDRYTGTSSQLSTTGQAITGSATVPLNGGDAYSNAFDLTSVNNGAPVAANVALVKPEHVSAFELGYRGRVSKFNIDLSAYYNKYKDFISTRTVLTPLYGEVGDNSYSLLALQNGDFQPYQTYTNSKADINSYGASIGVDTKVLNGFDFGLNYTYAQFDFDEATDPDFEPGFNTPEHKVKASFGKTELFQNFGFNVNWRWNDKYLWQSTFHNGYIPARNLIDAQINYTIPKWKSTFKVGGSNILGHDYISAPGSGAVGAQYFISWTINQ
ncbi:TonB-dependent receptor domain-containing protein [Oceanihabitans sediminis]|uniref:TonB-dependent receptor n=1 Tax=Oceanihabitans sediminis TaxID=1812012 RepID=UPI000930840A|nr:TonB-dependent receptor [Oceanihabitans sediminis]MDX1278030.1 TonB-dependent receptor [Oceanihabitans sediminis]